MKHVMLILLGLIISACNPFYSPQERYDLFTTHCVEAGGHIYTIDHESWCLNDNGGIIEVYP